jgi:RNA polymerase sigma-70 factor (ECF subfamily)
MFLELGDHAAAHEAFSRAISLATTAAEAAHIRQHLDRLEADHGAAKKSSGAVST